MLTSGINKDNLTERPILAHKKLIFVRHGSTVTDAAEGKDNRVPLSDEWKEEIIQIAHTLQQAWINGENSLLCYCEWDADAQIVRAKMTAEYLQNTVQWSSENILNNVHWVKTSNKSISNRVVRLLQTGHSAANYLDNFINKEVRNLHNNIEYVIFVIHKSSYSWIQAYLNDSLNLHNSAIPNWEAHVFDLNSELKPFQGVKNLCINFENYTDICSFTNILDSDLLTLQNHLNKTLHASPEITRNYLLDKSAPFALQRPCFVLCLERGDIDAIEAFVDQQDSNQLDSFFVEQLILNYPKTHGPLMNHLARLTLHERGALKSSFDNLKAPELYNSLLEKAAVLDEVNAVFKASIDIKIRSQWRKWVFNRSFLCKKNIEDSTIDSTWTTVVEYEIPAEYFCSNLVNGWKYQLAWIVGDGKTVWTASIVHDLIFSYADNHTVFFEARTLNKFDNEHQARLFWNERFHKADVICIDGIDEIVDTQLYNVFLSDIENISNIKKCGILLASRPKSSEFANYLQQISLKSLGIAEFLMGTLPKESEHIVIEKIYNMIDSNHAVTPLLLRFIQLLYAEDEILCSTWYNQLWINRFNDISNTNELYESIVRLILVVHDRKKDHPRYPRDYKKASLLVEEDMRSLGKLALNILRNQKNVLLTPRELLNFEWLSIVRIDETHWIEFVHKSFYEFFSAREIALHPEMICDFFELERTPKNTNTWKQYASIAPFLLAQLPDSTKFELMKDGSLYSSESLGLSHVDWWINALSSIKSDKLKISLLYNKKIVRKIFRKIFSELPHGIRPERTTTDFGVKHDLVSRWLINQKRTQAELYLTLLIQNWRKHQESISEIHNYINHISITTHEWHNDSVEKLAKWFMNHFSFSQTEDIVVTLLCCNILHQWKIDMHWQQVLQTQIDYYLGQVISESFSKPKDIIGKIQLFRKISDLNNIFNKKTENITFVTNQIERIFSQLIKKPEYLFAYKIVHNLTIDWNEFKNIWNEKISTIRKMLTIVADRSIYTDLELQILQNNKERVRETIFWKRVRSTGLEKETITHTKTRNQTQLLNALFDPLAYSEEFFFQLWHNYTLTNVQIDDWGLFWQWVHERICRNDDDLLIFISKAYVFLVDAYIKYPNVVMNESFQKIIFLLNEKVSTKNWIAQLLARLRKSENIHADNTSVGYVAPYTLERNFLYDITTVRVDRIWSEQIHKLYINRLDNFLYQIRLVLENKPADTDMESALSQNQYFYDCSIISTVNLLLKQWHKFHKNFILNLFKWSFLKFRKIRSKLDYQSIKDVETLEEILTFSLENRLSSTVTELLKILESDTYGDTAIANICEKYMSKWHRSILLRKKWERDQFFMSINIYYCEFIELVNASYFKKLIERWEQRAIEIVEEMNYWSEHINSLNYTRTLDYNQLNNTIWLQQKRVVDFRDTNGILLKSDVLTSR